MNNRVKLAEEVLIELDTLKIAIGHKEVMIIANMALNAARKLAEQTIKDCNDETH